MKAFKAKHQGVFKNPHEVYTSQLNNKNASMTGESEGCRSPATRLQLHVKQLSPRDRSACKNREKQEESHNPETFCTFTLKIT